MIVPGRPVSVQDARQARAEARVAGALDSSTPSFITGIIPATGTTPTAGSGFTYTHTNTSGVYVFTFATAMSSTPVILVTTLTANRAAYVTSVSTTGFTVNTISFAPAVNDSVFNFVAVGVQ